MSPELEKFLYGVLGGGVAALLFKLFDSYIIGFRVSESILAKKKFWQYSKALWFDCYELKHRLTSIKQKISNGNIDNNLEPLRFKLSQPIQLDWFTKGGYYATSTAYLFASVSSWIRLFQRDVVFLDFGKQNLTSNFFNIAEDLKNSISSEQSILWYHYFTGIGEIIIDQSQKMPLTFSSFTIKLYEDDNFRKYFEQLFYFLDNIVTKRQSKLIQEVLDSLDNTLTYLSQNSSIPKNTRYKAKKIS